MKTILFLSSLCLCLAFVNKANSQELDFDLKNYKTTDYKRRSLQFDLFSNQSANSDKTIESDSLKTFENEKRNSSVNSIFSVAPNFQSIRISREKIEEFGIQGGLRNVYSKSKYFRSDSVEIDNLNKNNQVSLSASSSYKVDKYYGQKNNFLKLGGMARIGSGAYFSESSNDDESSKPFKNITPSISVDFVLGHGHGRLEQVEDAVEALYILNELKKNGQLKREVSKDDIKSFADRITEIKQERFLDIWLYKQKSMVQLVSVLKELGLIGEESISLFNTIADYHYYAGINGRSSGSRFEYYITPLFSLYSSNNLKDFHSRDMCKHIGAGLNYYSTVPISIKWHKSAGFHVNGFIDSKQYVMKNKGQEPYHSDIRLTKGSHLGANYSIVYYPNTRTRVGSRIQSGFSYYEWESRMLNYSAGASINAGYYLSENVRINGEFNLDYNCSDYQKLNNSSGGTNFNSKGIRCNFEASLVYYLM